MSVTVTQEQKDIFESFASIYSNFTPDQKKGIIRALGGVETPAIIQDKFRDDLTRDELIAAFEEKVKYPSSIKDHVDPENFYHPQSNSILVFNMLEKPMKVDGEDETFVVGYVKSRGSYESKEASESVIADIIRKIDSENTNLITEVGKWTPIFMGEKSIGGSMMDREQVTYVLDDEGDTEDLNSLHSQMTEETSQRNRKIVDDINERKKKLEEESLQEENKDSLNYYIRRRVVEMSLKDAIKSSQVQLDDLNSKYTSNALYLACVDRIHPEYSKPPSEEFVDEMIGEASSSNHRNISNSDDMWLFKYNVDRVTQGVNPMVPVESLFEHLENTQSEFDPDIIERGSLNLEKVLRGELETLT